MDIVREIGVSARAQETDYSFNEEYSCIRRDARDLVFHRLFSSKERVLEVYKTLHPEDKDVRLEDLEITTIVNSKQMLAGNDLSFTVRGKMVFLIEAQTTENENTPLRILGYLLDWYQILLKKQLREKAIYKKKAVPLPVPEAYVIFSNTEEKRDVMSLAQIHFQNDKVLEFKVKVLTKQRASGIILEYIQFCEVFKEMFDLYGASKENWDRIISVCKDNGILVDFLTQYGDELMEGFHFLMTTDELWEEEIRCLKQEVDDFKKEADDYKKKANDFKKQLVHNLREQGMSDEKICNLTNMSFEELKSYS